MLILDSFVEFETAADLKKAVEALDGREFKEARVTCVANVGNSRYLPQPSARCSPDYRPSPIYRDVADLARLVLADHTLLVMTLTAVVLHPGVSARAEILTVTATVREARVATTTTTVLDIDLLHAVDPQMTTRLLGVAMMIRTVATTLLLIHT